MRLIKKLKSESQKTFYYLDNIETKIIVRIEPKKRVKIKVKQPVKPEDNIKLRLRNYKKID